MSSYRQKPKYVEKGTKYVEKDSGIQHQPKRNGGWIQKKKENSKYRQIDTGGYDYDPSTITETTVIPKLPKKEQLLSYPNQNEWQQKESLLLEQIKNLKNKRREVHNSKYIREKHVRSSDGEPNVFSQYDIEYDQLNKLKEQKNALLKQIRPRKQEIQHLTEELDKLNLELKSYEGEGRRSKQALEQRLSDLQEQRVKGALNTKQQKAINQEIQNIKKELGSAVSYENIEIRRVFINQKKGEILSRRNILFKEKKPYSDQFDIVNKQFMDQNDKVKALIDKFDQTNKARQNFKEQIEKGREDFFKSKDQKKRQIDTQIESIHDKIDDLWNDYDKKVDQYKKQEKLIEHINWMSKQKQYLIAQKKRQENRKLWEQRQKAKKEKQLEWEKNKPKKYSPNISNCQFLIQYCQRLRPKQVEQKVVQKQEKLTPEQIEKILNDDKHWKKEKGVSVIQSKKSREDDDNKPKKVFKHQVEADKESEIVNYSHDFSVAALFEDVKTLPPQTQKELDKVIGQLRERIAYYSKMNEEQPNQTSDNKQQYRVRQEHGDERSEKAERNERKNNQKQTKYQSKAQDFPTL